MVHIYHIYVEYYSAIKNNEIMPFAATWMHPEITTLSQKEKDKYHITSFIHRILKNDITQLIYKTETDSKTSKTNLPKGKQPYQKVKSTDTHYYI